MSVFVFEREREWARNFMFLTATVRKGKPVTFAVRMGTENYCYNIWEPANHVFPRRILNVDSATMSDVVYIYWAGLFCCVVVW